MAALDAPAKKEDPAKAVETPEEEETTPEKAAETPAKAGDPAVATPAVETPAVTPAPEEASWLASLSSSMKALAPSSISDAASAAYQGVKTGLNSSVEYLSSAAAATKVAAQSLWDTDSGWSATALNLPELSFEDLKAFTSDSTVTPIVPAVDRTSDKGFCGPAMDEWLGGWVDQFMDNFGTPQDSNTVAGVDSTGKPTEISTKPGEVTHKSGDGTETTITGSLIQAAKDGWSYTKDKLTGVQKEVTDNWSWITSTDGPGQGILKGADGTVIQVTDKAVTQTLPDGTVKVITDEAVLTLIHNKIRIGQARGKLPNDSTTSGELTPGQADMVANTDVAALPGGVINVKLPDGNLIMHPDGRREFRLNDGSQVLIRADKTYQAFDAEGKPIAMSEVAGFKRNADGSMTIHGQTLKDDVITTDKGLTLAAGTNVVTMMENGELVTLKFDKEGNSHVVRAVAPEGHRTNPDGTPDMAGLRITEDQSVSTTTAAILAVNPEKPDKPSIQVDADKPGDIKFAIAGEDKPFIVNLDTDETTTSAGTHYTPEGTQLNDGTRIDEQNNVLFDDGMYVDEAGNVYDGDNYVGSGAWSTLEAAHEEAALEAAESQAAGVVAAAEAIAAKISGMTPDSITPGNIAELLAAFSSLASLKGVLAAAGAATAPVDSASAQVCGSLSEARIASTLRDMAFRVAGPVPAGVLNAMYNMAHGTDYTSVMNCLERYGVAAPKLSAVADRPDDYQRAS